MGVAVREAYQRKSRMVEISLYGSGEGLGFRKVFAGPYVRSSYLADELFAE